MKKTISVDLRGKIKRKRYNLHLFLQVVAEYSVQLLGVVLNKAIKCSPIK